MTQKGPAEYAGYVSIKKKNGTDDIETIRFSHDREQAEDFSGPRSSEIICAIPVTAADASNSETALGDDALAPIVKFCSTLMARFNAAISAFHGLVEIGTYIRPAFAHSIMERTVLQLVKDGGTKLTDLGDIETYGLPLGVTAEINKHIDRVSETDRGLALLPSSILLSLVATFDSIIADTIKDILTINPVHLMSSEKQITYKELFEFGDVGEIKARIIDGEVDRLLRGSHEAQVEYIEKLVGTKIASHYARMPNFLEIFERRNQVAHASGLVTGQYIDKCKKFKYDTTSLSTGDRLDLRPRYLHKAIDILLEFGILLSFIAWRKLGNHKESDKLAYIALNDSCLEFIKKRRYNLAIWLLDFALFRQTRVDEESVIRNMVLNLANAYKKIDKIEDMERVISCLNWSATSDLYRIGLASLREDIDEVTSLLPILKISQTLSKHSFREWPIFDWVRDDAAVAKKFEEVFEEPLVLGIVESSAVSEGEPIELALAGATRH